jgi:hypothetical protein
VIASASHPPESTQRTPIPFLNTQNRLDELDVATARELLSRTRHRAAFAGVPPTPEAAAYFLSYV